MNAWIHALLSKNNEIQDVSVGETLAYTWFGRPNYAYSESAQKYWIGSTKDTVSGTTQHITEFNLTTGEYTTTQVGTVYEKDDHNQVQIIVRNSDGRLVIFYAEHSGAAVRIRISVNPYDASSWGSEVALNPIGGACTYPSPYQNSNGDIFCFFRNIHSANISTWRYLKSTDGGENFTDGGLLYDDGVTKAYMITCQDGDKVHFINTNGHPQTNPDLNVQPYHFYFNMVDETCRKSNDSIIPTPINFDDLTQIATTTGNDTGWILDITTKFGLPRVLYVVYPDGRINNLLDKELWFAEWDGAAWVNQTFITETLSGYMEDDVSVQEFGYPPGSRFDTNNPDIIWMPKQVNGILEIHKVDISNLSNIYIEQITYNSEVDNWRPISIPGKVVNNLLWIQKTRYDMYDDYEMGLLSKTELTK